MNKIISIFSQGCAANFGDGEQIARLLESCGYKTVFAQENADAFCLNVCTVKGDSTALQLLRKIQNANSSAPILLTGCIPPEPSGFSAGSAAGTGPGNRSRSRS